MATKSKGSGTRGFKENFKGFFEDLKIFILRGNLVDLAIGIVIGAAFGAIIQSLVVDIMMPILSLMGTGNVMEELFWVLREGSPGNYTTRKDAKDHGAITMNYGNFLQTIIDFLIIAIALFLFLKLIILIRRKADAENTEWSCPKCKEAVKKGAIRCPHCAAEPIRPEENEEESGSGEETVLIEAS